MTEPLTSATPNLAQDLSARFDEPEWLRTQREVSWQQFLAAPAPRLEKSDLTRRGFDVGALPTALTGAGVPDAEPLLRDAEAPVILVQDGMVVEVRLPRALVEQGVVFADLHTAVATHGDLVKRHLGTVVGLEESKWNALNTAVWQGGAFLYVPRNVVLDTVFSYVYSETESSGGAFPRVLIVAEEGSSVQFQEMYFQAALDKGRLVHSSVTEVVAHANARVSVSVATEFGQGRTHFVTKRAKLHRDADVQWTYVDAGDGYTVGVIESVCEGAGSNSNVRALGVGSGRQHLDLTASIVHKGPHSTSDIVMHGVLKGRANAIFRSRTHIVRGAVAASSEQSDRMVVLDGTARADAIPMLLIDENDVSRCGHAASVGKIDPNQVYYLMSRGVPESAAKYMILWGHLQPTVDTIPSTAVRDIVMQRIEKELAK